MKRLILIAALVLIPWQALAVELDADSNGYTDADKGGTNAATEQDPTVDTSAEIQAIIGAGVYQAPLVAGTDYLAPDGDGSGLSGVVLNSLFNAYGIPYSDTDDTPAFLSITANTIPGRLAAGMAALPVDATGDCAAGSACFGGHEHSTYEVATTYQAVTEATEGTDGNPATMTLTPTAGIGLHIVEITCEDPDGVVLTMSETGAVNLSRVLIIQASTPDISIADSAGVQEMSGTITLANAGENVMLEYSSAIAAWVQVGQPNVLSFSVSSINIQSGTINGAIRPINQASDTYTLGTNSTADSWGTYFTNTDAAADGAAYTMESAVAGMHFCLENDQGVTEVLSVTPGTGDYLVKNGARGTAATARASSGAAGDKICVFCQDATDCKITAEVGTWAE